MFSPEELTRTALQAVQNLSITQKADFLLQTALNMIESGRYGEEVERYLEVFLATPGISQEQVTSALIARGNARRIAADRLLTRAHQDFHAVARIDPTNHEVLDQIRHEFVPPYSSQPAHRRVPLEIWEAIASYIPKFHLRAWFSVSVFYRNIARRQIFRSIDIYFGDDNDKEISINRGLDIFDRAKRDPSFAKLVKALRIHWSYEEGDLLDLMKRIFREALPSFTALTEFEWIGYPEMKGDIVHAIFSSHPNLKALALVGWHFDGVGVTNFTNLREFTLRAEDDDGDADMDEVRAVLDRNQETLERLTLGAYLMRHHSWDDAFRSATIQKLTHLDLVDTRISHFVLTRIALAPNLKSLTLHGTFERPNAASVVFGSDQELEGRHTLWPKLEAFRFIMVGHDDEIALFQSVVSFLRGRNKIRRLDLGDCPWDLVKKLLPGLIGLRVLRIRIPKLNEQIAQDFVGAVPSNMLVIHLSVVVSDRSINTYAPWFRRFFALSLLHLASTSVRRPQSNTDRDYQAWCREAKSVPSVLPSLDFLGWHGEHYVVVRDGSKRVVDLKELPARRRLDSGKGVDLGTDDACWLERKDVPIDFERSGLENS
ncbi:hypothetical protein M422DRAFT_172759 [Sphaerobolus stellatus SS14]|uniref:F-box domain-containing protein n=1 Tax=Sphaerobolus stellatus (strain SS14) TaxID=990650 RepID=A0A0C9V218_SPHS4|nr:hypothetical protein M422DRAFT_172759 [Sphaerobolus stellatus SS14]